MSVAKAVLLVGSARPTGGSTSESLGRHLLSRLEEGGVEWALFHVARVGKDPVPLVEALDGADLFVLSTPLYVDALPYLVTLALETVAASAPRDDARRRFVAIVNGGFPEARHTRSALAIARAFAHRAGLEWAGGLGLGGGEMIGGRALSEVGWPARRVERALDLAADALLAGGSVPDEAVETMARPMVPAFLYTRLGNARWWKAARGNGVADRIDARPYVDEAPIREPGPGTAEGVWPAIAPRR